MPEPPAARTALHLWVRGRVQGVGFRAFTRGRAAELGLRGWVRNLPDGRVEARAVGDVGALRAWREAVQQGPRFAVVQDLKVVEESADAEPLEEDFRVLR